MAETTCPTRFFLAAGLLALALAFALSPYDLEVSAALYEPGTAFGQAVAHYGAWHAFLLYPLAILLLAWPAKRRGYPLLAQGAAVLLTQALLHTELLTTLVKWLWGRPRYGQVLAGQAPFATPFSWQTGSGFVSFPSGHVATALVALPLALLLWRAGRRGAAGVVFCGTLLYGILTAYGRIMNGAHYLSDVTASLGLALLCSPLSLYLGTRYLRLFKD